MKRFMCDEDRSCEYEVSAIMREDSDGPYVLFNAAQSELAALREELANQVMTIQELTGANEVMREELAERRRKHLRSSQIAIGKSQLAKERQAHINIRDRELEFAAEHAGELHQRLTAAERRNVELVASIVALPDEFKELSGCENTAGVYARIDYISDWVAELAKPTESGASE